MAREDNIFRRVNGFISIILFGLLVCWFVGLLVCWFMVMVSWFVGLWLWFLGFTLVSYQFFGVNP
jgi:hypothetical protein